MALHENDRLREDLKGKSIQEMGTSELYIDGIPAKDYGTPYSQSFYPKNCKED